MGKGVVDDAHPRCLGTATLSSGDLVHEAVEAADLIVNVGHDLCEKPPFVMRPDGAEVIHVAFEPASVDPVYYRTAEPHTLLLDNALATMGAGLPVAIGAKQAWPERKVIAIAGDGGFTMNGGELETAVRLGLDLVVVVVRDDALGMIRWKQRVAGFPDYGLRFGNPDFVKYAEAHGAGGHRVGEAGLRPLLDSALEAGGVHLIEAPIDYSTNAAEFG